MSEDEDAGLRTKRYLRRAHRASTTRSINQIEGAIEANDVRRLRQLKQFLTIKLAVLVKLDDEIIQLVQEDDLAAEVEQADEVRSCHPHH